MIQKVRDQSSFISLNLLKFHLNGMVFTTNKSRYLIDLIRFPQPYNNIFYPEMNVQAKNIYIYESNL